MSRLHGEVPLHTSLVLQSHEVRDTIFTNHEAGWPSAQRPYHRMNVVGFFVLSTRGRLALYFRLLAPFTTVLSLLPPSVAVAYS